MQVTCTLPKMSLDKEAIMGYSLVHQEEGGSMSNLIQELDPKHDHREQFADYPWFLERRSNSNVCDTRARMPNGHSRFVRFRGSREEVDAHNATLKEQG